MKLYLGTLACMIILIINIRADPHCESIEKQNLEACAAAVQRWNELKKTFYEKCCARGGKSECQSDMCGEVAAQKATITIMMEHKNWMDIIQLHLAPASAADDRVALGPRNFLHKLFATKTPETRRE